MGRSNRAALKDLFSASCFPILIRLRRSRLGSGGFGIWATMRAMSDENASDTCHGGGGAGSVVRWFDRAAPLSAPPWLATRLLVAQGDGLKVLAVVLLGKRQRLGGCHLKRERVRRNSLPAVSSLGATPQARGWGACAGMHRGRMRACTRPGQHPPAARRRPCCQR